MIQVTQVSKRFGPVAALDGVSLRVDEGERVAFIGANGSGKTTLLRALLGLVRFEGRITLAGVDVAREPELALRSVAYIPQVAPPIEAPVREVLRAYAALRGRPVRDLEERAAALGLDVRKSEGKRFRDLSGGMKQKLLASMALAVEAPILVCDEPTANLDGDARVEFFRQLDERPRGSVVVLSSHRIEEVTQLVDRVVELSDGRVARDTTLEALLRDLRAFRVEVTLRDGSEAAAAALVSRGLVRGAEGRFVGQFSRDEKVTIVARLLREHEAAIVDLAITAVEDMNAVLRADGASRPKLKVVS